MNVLDLLKRYTFIESYEIVWEWPKKTLSIHLLKTWTLAENTPTITFFSKPSRRRYVWRQELRNVAGWVWIWILSTNQGLMASHEAKKRKIWWELIAEIY
jgi:ribosomal protein S8